MPSSSPFLWLTIPKPLGCKLDVSDVHDCGDGMTSSGPISSLTKMLGLFGIFVMGGVSHWTYSQINGGTGLDGARNGTTVTAQWQAGRSPVPGADRLLKNSSAIPGSPALEVWRAEKPSQTGLAKSFTARRQALAEAKIVAQRLAWAGEAIRTMARDSAAPPDLSFPVHVRNPAAVVVTMAGIAARPAELSLPAILVKAGKLARAERAINLIATARAPAPLDSDQIVAAALRSQLEQSRHVAHARQQAMQKALQAARLRLSRLVERQIHVAAGVAGPAQTSVGAAASPVITASASATQAGARTSTDSGGAVSASIPVQDARVAGVGLPPKPASGTTDATDPKVLARSHPMRELAMLPSSDKAREAVKVAQLEKIDVTGLREAVDAFKKGDMDNGRAHAKRAAHPVTAAAAMWAEVSLQPRKAGYSRIIAFLEKYPDWPMRRWLHWRAEQSLFIDRPARRHAKDYLAKYTPVSPIGRLVQARYLLEQNKKSAASKVVSQAWREGRFNTWLERIFLKEFRGQLSSADLQYRADKMFYRERYSNSLRLAGRAGKSVYALAAARVAVARGGSPTKFGAKLSAKQRKDPSWKFAQALRLRRAGKVVAAGEMIQAAKAPANGPSDASGWWMERRMIARRLLDRDKPQLAYSVAASHGIKAGGKTRGNRKSLVDAEFYSGWLALRFAGKPVKALGHFSIALEHAKRPNSRARAAYWQGRAAEKSPQPEDAERLYALAAQYSSTYYGQLARARLIGTTLVPVRRAKTTAQGAGRLLAVRAVDVLKRIDAKAVSQRLAFGLAKQIKDRSQLAALANIMARDKDARGTLIVGKLASYRGIQLDNVAFPDFGIPRYTALKNSAERSMVYAIARQESAFQARAKSHAGAKGLMQMLTSTARVTARRKGIPFDANRLISDPAFNAQLGAAHLGDLMEEHPGSLTLVFAAYNAGGGRVNQWIKAYGDPRKEGVDPIDWVERIPIAETRHYVQRVTENLGVYRSILGQEGMPHPASSEFPAFASAW